MLVSMAIDRRLQDLAQDAGAEWVVPGLLRLPLPTPTLPPATMTNHYVAGKSSAVLVDPSAPARRDQDRLCALLERLADEGGVVLHALFLTHHHRDHVGAAMLLADRLGLPIWAHRATQERLAGEVTVDQLVVEGDSVAVDDEGNWRAMHTPGHAPGHLILQHDGHHGMIAGDMVAGEGTILIDPRDGTMGDYLASLQRMADAHPSFLAPAHGPVLRDGPASLAYYREHRLAREAKVLQALPQQFTPPEDLLPAAYGDVSRLAWPMALRSMLAHLQHLAELGQAEVQAGRWRRT
jgi:ribonuclease/clavin/mitogillin